MDLIEELRGLARELGGELYPEKIPYIRIDTGDNTSKENYDDLIEIVSDIKLNHWVIKEYWADHDTQIIEFKDK